MSDSKKKYIYEGGRTPYQRRRSKEKYLIAKSPELATAVEVVEAEDHNGNAEEALEEVHTHDKVFAIFDKGHREDD